MFERALTALRFTFGRILILLVVSLCLNIAQAQSAGSCEDLFASFEYPRIVEKVDPLEPHTIEDVTSYLKSKMGPEIIDLARDKNTDFIVLKGHGKKTAGFFQSDNILRYKELKNPFGAFNVVKVDYRGGGSSVVITNVNGQSRYIQVLSFLRLLHVPESKIRVKGYLRSYKSVYKRTFESIGKAPDLVVFGFSNTSFEIIAHSQPVLGIKSREMHELNHSYATNKWIKPSFEEHELQNMGVQVMKFKNGKTIWFIDNEYGDRATVLVEAMQDHGIKNILLLGTAGALNPAYSVGQLVSPDFYVRPNGSVVPSNSKSPSIEKEGEHVHVDSPGLETKAWLKEQVSDGVDFVDVELQKVSNVIRPDVHYETYLIISDVLNSEKPQDYTKWSEQSRQNTMVTLKPILNDSLKRIGITPTTPIQSFDVHYFQVAPPKEESGGL